MRFIITCILISILCSCAERSRPNVKYVTEKVPIIIHRISVAKYSKVYATAYFRGIPVPVNNGGNGYYYKKYTVRPGALFYRTITFAFITENGETRISSARNLDVSEFEVK